MNSIYEEAVNAIPFKARRGRLEADGSGNLHMDGVDLPELARQYGTPLFVFSERSLRANYRDMRRIFSRYFEKLEICFACKSNSLLAVLRTLREEGAWADVVSGGEYYKALKAGVPGERIVFNGNNKKREELKQAIENGSLINVDSIAELYMVHEAAGDLGTKAKISIRVNGDISPDIIAEFATAQKGSKFGVDLDGEAFSAYRYASQSPHMEVLGIHSHIGSQIEDSRYYRHAGERIMDFVGVLKKELGIELTYVNMGGGFGIPFDYLTQPDGLEAFASSIHSIIQSKVKEYGLKTPVLMIEPGASLAGTCAVTLMKVGTVKQREGKKLAALDGGGDTLLRATQGWYTYRALCANKMDQPEEEICDLVGPLCYEGDVLARGRRMCVLKENDILAFLDTGAYTTSLMNNYNGRPTAAAVMITESGDVKLIKRRQSLEDLISGEE